MLIQIDDEIFFIHIHILNAPSAGDFLPNVMAFGLQREILLL